MLIVNFISTMTTINLQMKNLIKKIKTVQSCQNGETGMLVNEKSFLGKPEPQLSMIFNEVSLLC